MKFHIFALLFVVLGITGCQTTTPEETTKNISYDGAKLSLPSPVRDGITAIKRQDTHNMMREIYLFDNGGTLLHLHSLDKYFVTDNKTFKTVMESLLPSEVFAVAKQSPIETQGKIRWVQFTAPSQYQCYFIQMPLGFSENLVGGRSGQTNVLYGSGCVAPEKYNKDQIIAMMAAIKFK